MLQSGLTGLLVSWSLNMPCSFRSSCFVHTVSFVLPFYFCVSNSSSLLWGAFYDSQAPPSKHGTVFIITITWLNYKYGFENPFSIRLWTPWKQELQLTVFVWLVLTLVSESWPMMEKDRTGIWYLNLRVITALGSWMVTWRQLQVSFWCYEGKLLQVN